MEPEGHFDVVLEFLSDREVVCAEVDPARTRPKSYSRVLAEVVPPLSGSGSHHPSGRAVREVQRDVVVMQGPPALDSVLDLGRLQETRLIQSGPLDVYGGPKILAVGTDRDRARLEHQIGRTQPGLELPFLPFRPLYRGR